MKSTLIICIGLVTFKSLAQTYDTNSETVSTFAGSGIATFMDGQGVQAEFSNPEGVVSDTANNLYVLDANDYRIRKITTNATVTTLVGGGSDLGGQGTNVSLSAYSVIGTLTIDHSNTIWLLASYVGGSYLLNISTSGFVSIQNGGPGLTNLATSSGVCFDSQNNLYYSGGSRIWKYTPATGALQAYAGSGVSGHLDGSGIFTEFVSPTSLACDSANSIYVQDSGSIRRVDASQNVTTLTNSFSGSICGVDSAGNILAVNANAIEKLTATTNIVIYAGTTAFSSGTMTNGPGNLARFNNPTHACFSQGSIFVADTSNEAIRQIAFNAQPQPVAGGSLAIGEYAGVNLSGILGRTYQVQSSVDMANWTTRATLLLTASPYLWIDPAGTAGKGFYRAFLLP